MLPPSAPRLATAGRVLLVAVCAAGLAFPGATASGAAAALRRYPYLTGVAGGNATVNWATDRSAATGSLLWGAAAADGSCAPTTTVTAVPSSMTVNGVAEYQWKAAFGARAATTYCYRVLLAAADLLGADATPRFTTPGGVGPGSSTFAVFGDWGKVDQTGANPDQAGVMAQLARSGARYAVSTGDVPYGPTTAGVTVTTESQYGDLVAVGDGLSSVFGPTFWAVPGRSLPLFPTLGNHGQTSEFLKDWPTGSTASRSGGIFGSVTYGSGYNGVPTTSLPSAWYAFDVGSTRFYALEAAWPNSKTSTGKSPELYQDDWGFHWQSSAAEYRWLENDLATHPSQLKIAFFHFPLYADNATETSDAWLQGPTSLEGLLGRYGVSLVFNGHAHVYERNAQRGGVVSYVTGGGGATLEPVSCCSAFDAYALGWSPSGGSSCSAPRPTSVSQVYHFLLVSVDGTNVTVTPTDELGRTFDVQTYSFPARGPLLADGFERGDLTAWTTTAGLTVGSAEVRSGSFAARATSTGAATSATANLATPQTDLYGRLAFKVVSQGANNVYLLKLRTGAGGSIVGLYRTPTGTLGLRNDVAGTTASSSTVASTGAWHTVQLHVAIAGSSSHTDVTLDGVPIGALTTSQDLGTAPVGRVQLGDSTGGRTYDVALDDVAVSAPVSP